MDQTVKEVALKLVKRENYCLNLVEFSGQKGAILQLYRLKDDIKVQRYKTLMEKYPEILEHFNGIQGVIQLFGSEDSYKVQVEEGVIILNDKERIFKIVLDLAPLEENGINGELSRSRMKKHCENSQQEELFNQSNTEQPSQIQKDEYRASKQQKNLSPKIFISKIATNPLTFIYLILFIVIYSQGEQIDHLNNIVEQLTYKHQKIQTQLNQLTDIQKTIIPHCNLIVHPESPHIGKYLAFGGYIEKIDSSGQYHQLFGSIALKNKSVNKFTILQTENGFMHFGIIDKKYLGDEESETVGRKQCIFYRMKNGNVIVGGRWSSPVLGKAISEVGQTIVMEASNNTIRWKIGDKILNEYTDQMIGDSSIEWMPVIQMWNKRDKIKWQ